MGGLFTTAVMSMLVFTAVGLSVYTGWVPISGWIRRREGFFQKALYQLYQPNLSPRKTAWASAALIPLLAVLCVIFLDLGSTAQSTGMDDAIFKGGVAIIGALAGLFAAPVITNYLIRRRVRKLEEQIVSGIQTLASGVRAGLNLVQSFQLLARNASAPLRQEMGQLLREYEHGLTLEQAMSKTGARIGSPTYRLLFSALETHRLRGGNLGETLDRIAEAIREIQRLEKHVETLTAQGRAAARMMGIMPFVILAILYFIDKEGVRDLFTTTVGRFMLLAVGILIGFGFWWIRKIVDIDI